MTYGNFTGKAKETPLNSTAISNILLEMPDINAEWLLTGKGNMLKEVTKDASQTNPDSSMLIDRICELSAENAVLKKEIEDLKRDKPSIQHYSHVDSTELMKK